MKHRIEVYTTATGNTFRELHKVTRNEHGDILLTLDSGEQITFTPKREDTPAPMAETILAVAQGGPRLSIIKSADSVIWGDMRITAAAKQAPTATAQTDPGELERLRAFARAGKADAIRAVCSQFDALPESVIVAGWLHAKGMTWDAMQKATKCGRATLSKRINQFYQATGWPKADRRQGIGKTYQLDESRDAGSTETEL